MSGATENAKMLAALLGVDEDEAAEKLQRRVLITSAEGAAKAWGNEIASLLERTVSLTEDPESADVELVLGDVAKRSDHPAVFASIDADHAVVSRSPVPKHKGNSPHPLFAMVCACGAAAAVLNAAVQDARLPPSPDPLEIKFGDLGLPNLENLEPIDLTGAVLVGAGAVAHGFLKALRHLPVEGRLDVLDPKIVGSGNPNRCLYMTADDVDEPKAEVLVDRASADFPNLKLVPHKIEFGAFAGQPVPLAIVTIDSRRARRSLQLFAPGRVLDASTTDVRGVVVHSHIQPTDDACLACIYEHIPDEAAREKSIAEGLGISLEDVAQGLIDIVMAQKICRLYPHLDPEILVNKAFDTLFRELCGAQALRTPEGKQVLTPFAFVSALAGALLAVELVRQVNGLAQTNYWQVDPWRAPLARVRRKRSKVANCEFCSLPDTPAVVRRYWGEGG